MNVEAEVIAKVTGWLSSVPSVTRAWGFGSRAKGNFKPDSDLDIAVSLRPGDGKILAEWIFNGDVWASQINELVGGNPRIDLQLADEELLNGVVWPAILDHGVLIYEVPRP